MNSYEVNAFCGHCGGDAGEYEPGTYFSRCVKCKTRDWVDADAIVKKDPAALELAIRWKINLVELMARFCKHERDFGIMRRFVTITV